VAVASAGLYATLTPFDLLKRLAVEELPSRTLKVIAIAAIR